MNDSYKVILLKILDAIEYTGDKEAFAIEFMQNIYMQTVMDLMNSLPNEKQEEAKKEFAEATTDEKVTEILKKYFSEDQRPKAFTDAMNKGIMGWMQEIEHTLNNRQKKNLADLAETFSQGTS